MTNEFIDFFIDVNLKLLDLKRHHYVLSEGNDYMCLSFMTDDSYRTITVNRASVYSENRWYLEYREMLMYRGEMTGVYVDHRYHSFDLIDIYRLSHSDRSIPKTYRHYDDTHVLLEIVNRIVGGVSISDYFENELHDVLDYYRYLLAMNTVFTNLRDIDFNNTTVDISILDNVLTMSLPRYSIVIDRYNNDKCKVVIDDLEFTYDRPFNINTKNTLLPIACINLFRIYCDSNLSDATEFYNDFVAIYHDHLAK